MDGAEYASAAAQTQWICNFKFPKLVPTLDILKERHFALQKQMIMVDLNSDVHLVCERIGKDSKESTQASVHNFLIILTT
jgi:hypothetical protein